MNTAFFEANLPKPGGCLIYTPQLEKCFQTARRISRYALQEDKLLCAVLDASPKLDGSRGLAFTRTSVYWLDEYRRSAGCLRYRDLAGADTVKDGDKTLLRLKYNSLYGPCTLDCIALEAGAAAMLAEFFNTWQEAFAKGCSRAEAISDAIYDAPPLPPVQNPAMPWLNTTQPRLLPGRPLDVRAWLLAYAQAHPEYKRFVAGGFSQKDAQAWLAKWARYGAYSADVRRDESVVAMFPGSPGILLMADMNLLAPCCMLYVEAGVSFMGSPSTKPGSTMSSVERLLLNGFRPVGHNFISFGEKTVHVKDQKLVLQLLADLCAAAGESYCTQARQALDRVRTTWPAFRAFMEQDRSGSSSGYVSLAGSGISMIRGETDEAINRAANASAAEHNQPVDVLDSTKADDFRPDYAAYGWDICRASYLENLSHLRCVNPLDHGREPLRLLAHCMGGAVRIDQEALACGLNQKAAPAMYYAPGRAERLTACWLADPEKPGKCDMVGWYGSISEVKGFVVRMDGRTGCYPRAVYGGFALDESDRLIAFRRDNWPGEDTGIQLSGDKALALIALNREWRQPTAETMWEEFADYSRLGGHAYYRTGKDTYRGIDVENPFAAYRKTEMKRQDVQEEYLWLHPAFLVERSADLEKIRYRSSSILGSGLLIDHVLAYDYLGRLWTRERDQEWNLYCGLLSSICVGTWEVDTKSYYHCIAPGTLQYRERSVCRQRSKKWDEKLQAETEAD